MQASLICGPDEAIGEQDDGAGIGGGEAVNPAQHITSSSARRSGHSGQRHAIGIGYVGVARPRPERRPNGHTIRPGCAGYGRPLPFDRVTCAVSRNNVSRRPRRNDSSNRSSAWGRPAANHPMAPADSRAGAARRWPAAPPPESRHDPHGKRADLQHRTMRIGTAHSAVAIVFGQRPRRERRPAQISRDRAAHVGDQPRQHRIVGRAMPLVRRASFPRRRVLARLEAAIVPDLRFTAFSKPARCAMPDA